MNRTWRSLFAWTILAGWGGIRAAAEPLSDVRVPLDSNMVFSDSGVSDASGLTDEQDRIVGPPVGEPVTVWTVDSRYPRLTRRTPGANLTEVAVYENTPEAHRAMLEPRAAEDAAHAVREAAMAHAREEMAKRPKVDLGPPFEEMVLVDEIDCAVIAPAEDPAGVSRAETILGRPCRVMAPTEKEGAWMSYRIGRMKRLQPGDAYVLAVDYPEDVPRNMVVINTGNETSRGFHTGPTLGDALHAKYVDSLCESIDVPLSGDWETWTLLFRLHDRFPEKGLVRGNGQRPLVPEDGFDVTIAQFPARCMPVSRGAAVSRIRLFAVPDPARLAQPVRLPPDGLPRRRLFWREEMADGVLGAKSSDPTDRGVANRLNWYRHKAELMRFLGMNTFTKDLLEFGACQHWDPTPYGGHDWVFFDEETRDLWAEVVSLMGAYGFEVLPYYEYSGSLGYQGLGTQKRCRPLGRDDAYTHIGWIEKANADITDPSTIEDFRKMLDCTVVRLRDRASFAGIWLRPRSQMPVSFSDEALHRFAVDANRGAPVFRDQLRNDRALYDRYLDWWGGRRHDFLVAARAYLAENGIENPTVLFTGCPAEPGVGFPSWEPRLVTDLPEVWAPILARPEHRTDKGEVIRAVPLRDVVEQDLYLHALTSPGLTWGGWEVQHARPADDPQRYRDTEGILLTHAFNRLYTVASPRTFDAYRTVSGLAVIRHYALNENMMFDSEDNDKLGYFVADIERAGPYCMMAEAMAMARGDPTMIGYLVGTNFGRGFPLYVRQFNAAFLALPALPSRVVEGAADASEIVVREIATPRHGTWYAVVHAGWSARDGVSIRLPGNGAVHDAVTGTLLSTQSVVKTSFYPFELKAWQQVTPQ